MVEQKKIITPRIANPRAPKFSCYFFFNIHLCEEFGITQECVFEPVSHPEGILLKKFKINFVPESQPEQDKDKKGKK